MKKLIGRVALGAVGLAVGVIAVVALREATLSTHEGIVRGSRIELVVEAHTKGAERTQELHEMVEAQLLACRLEVKSDVVGEIEARGDSRFRAVLEPSMDKSDRRQFRGCLEDWVIDHFQMDVVHLDDVT